MLIILKTIYEFRDEKIPDNNNHEHVVLYKWTNSCERMSVILSTQVIDESTDQQDDQYEITMCRYNTHT